MMIDKKILLNYFKYSNSSANELRCITNLYKSYLFINELQDGDYINYEKKLLEYEDKIYMIDGNKLTEQQKIELEINRIERIINKDNSVDSNNEIKKEIETLKKLLVNNEQNVEQDNTTINYMKKKISIIQALLGIKNNFLLAVHQAFIEKYMNICLEQKEEKTILEYKK